MKVEGSNLAFHTKRYIRINHEYSIIDEVYVYGKKVWPGPKPFQMRVGQPLTILLLHGKIELLPRHEFKKDDEVVFLCDFVFEGDYIDLISGLTDIGHWVIDLASVQHIEAEFTDDPISWSDYRWVRDTWDRVQPDDESKMVVQMKEIWQQLKEWRTWMR